MKKYHAVAIVSERPYSIYDGSYVHDALVGEPDDMRGTVYALLCRAKATSEVDAREIIEGTLMGRDIELTEPLVRLDLGQRALTRKEKRLWAKLGNGEAHINPTFLAFESEDYDTRASVLEILRGGVTKTKRQPWLRRTPKCRRRSCAELDASSALAEGFIFDLREEDPAPRPASVLLSLIPFVGSLLQWDSDDDEPEAQYLLYRFNVPTEGGTRAFSGMDRFEGPAYMAAGNVGKKAEVRYLPENPRTSRINKIYDEIASSLAGSEDTD